MAKAAVVDWKNQKVSEVELPDSIFGVEVRNDILHQVVKWQLACKRQGTHATKTKGLVSGGGKKPFKQKGTGNARQGSTRSPLMPGGGTMFGPQPRDYSYNLPLKVRQAGLKSALSLLFKDGKVTLVKDLKSKDGKTKGLVTQLKGLGLEKAFIIDGQIDQLFERSTRNVKAVKAVNVSKLNVYDLLKFGSLVTTPDAIAAIVQRCGVEA